MVGFHEEERSLGKQGGNKTHVNESCQGDIGVTEHRWGDIEEEAERNTTNMCLKCYNRTILYELLRNFF